MTLVAISSAYGAGGSRIGPALARRLGVPFVDRVIPAAVAEELSVPLYEAQAHDDRASRSVLERILSGFAAQDSGAPAAVPAATRSSEDFKQATEEAILAHAASGRGVILGRAAVVVLADHPSALRVRLTGPPEQRVVQAMEIEGVQRAVAERRLKSLDRTHTDYVKHLYGADIHNCALYHVVLDSTAIDLDSCVDMLDAAARSLAVATEGLPERDGETA